MNETMVKFGFPETLIREFEHWVVLLRPAQPTLGSLIIAARSDCTAFSDLPAAAFTELKTVVGMVERSLGVFVNYAKINYLMLMMVDPHVHYHVIPRYEGDREWNGTQFPDTGWPKTPDLANAIPLDADGIRAMRSAIQASFA